MLPINHLISTLQRKCCGEYEIINHTSSTDPVFAAVVRNVRTDEANTVTMLGNSWSSTSAFLSARLNGHTRDDAGEVAPSDGWKDHDGKGFPPDNFYATHVRLRSGEVFPRNLNSASGACWIWRDGPTDIVAYRPAASTDPIYETPEKVVL